MRLLLLLFAGIIFSVVQAEADIYEWLDDQGVTHFTDDPDRVPAKFKKRVKTRGSIKGDEVRQPEPVTDNKSLPAPVPAQTRTGEYGGHDEGWWRSSFSSLRTELKTLKESLPAKNEQLGILRHKRRVYQKASDRVKYYKQQESIERDQEKIAELEQRLTTLENEAAKAGVPFDWRR